MCCLFAADFHGAIPKPDDAPLPKTPEESAAAFRLPDGFRMEVAASEPLISSPSGVCWDEQGRMFVSELHGYNLAGQLDIEELNKSGKLDTKVRRVQADEKFKRAAEAGTFGVVKLLLDKNGDGRMDSAQAWATNLPPVYGLVPARGGVIAACAPHIVYLADRDGDGEVETREILFTGFPTGELERGINAPQWGVDGWIYFGRGWGGGKITGLRLSEPVELPGSDFRIRADGSAIEPITGATHTFGFALTESGERFVVTTTIPGIYIAPLPWRYLARNPDVATPNLEVPTGDRRVYSLSKPHPWRQKRADDPAYFKFYNSRYGAAESEAEGWFTAACGPMIYEDHALPGLHGQYFVCEPSGNLIHRANIVREGVTLTLRRDSKTEFAASADAWSHPMNLTHGPDGSIWVTDYYREIIEDYSAIPRHLQQQYGVYAGHDRGRIYRLTHRDAPRPPDSNLAKLETAALVEECASPLFWRRQTAQRLLIERRATNAAPGLRKLLSNKIAAVTAMHALDQLDALTSADLAPLISTVKVPAIRLADQRLEDENLLQELIAAAGREREPHVLLQLALSLGESRDPRAVAALAKLGREHGGVRWMDVAIRSSVRNAPAGPTNTDGQEEAADTLPTAEPLDEEALRTFSSALAAKRDPKRGRELFLVACAPCHRIGADGNEVGPDLLGQLGLGEESLLKEMLAPSDRIRPGYETTSIQLKSGGVLVGILKADAATSLTLAQAGGVEKIVLRKDVKSVRRTPVSMMPSFAKTLSPAEAADILAWLLSHR